MLLKHHA
jgi:hypothetical protein